MPSQDYPGLGVAREVLELLVLMAERLDKAGLVNRPQHFHNAFYYHEVFRYLDPEEEGRFVAMIRDCSDYDLKDVSWGIHLGCLKDRRTGSRVEWTGRDQVYALDDALRSCFDRRSYRLAVWETAAAQSYGFDEACFRRRMATALEARP